MAAISDFSAPAADVFTNVSALNAAYLDASSDLKGPQKGRLAMAPFLLFSIRETDIEWWGSALQREPQMQLLDRPDEIKGDLFAVQSAAIGFLWQLARYNPYVARVVSGASVAWCDMLTERPLVTILDRIAQRGDLLRARCVPLANGEDRMRTTGAGSSSVARRAAHIVELQNLLASGSRQRHPQFAAAACTMASVSRQVAEHRPRNAATKKL